jgi:glycosyltransferase involved in cell wall biosynthesis
MSGKPDENNTNGLTYVTISNKERKVALLSGGINLFFKVARQKPDVVQLFSIDQLPLGIAIKLFTKIKVVYDCREDMFHSIRDHKDRINKPLRWIFAYVAKFVEYISCEIFDGLVVSDSAIFDIHYYIPPEKKMIFYNTPSLKLFQSSYKPLTDRKYDVVLMGSMSPRTGVTNLLEATAILKQKGYVLKVLLLGQPLESVMGSINKITEDKQLKDQVEITGLMPHSEVPNWLQEVKIGVVGLLDMPKFRNNIACKAFEYMACGMPVVSSDLPPERLFIEEGKTGLFFKPGNTEELASCIKRLLDDLPKSGKMGAEGRKAVEGQWNCENMQKKLVQFYSDLLSG